MKHPTFLRLKCCRSRPLAIPFIFIAALPAIGFSNDAIRVNCGGPSCVDSKGLVYEADRPYSAGAWGWIGGSQAALSSDRDIRGTENDALHHSERWGFEAYKFHVDPGFHTATFIASESYYRQSGQRVFDILINGQAAAEDVDLAAKVGSDAELTIRRTFFTGDGVIVISTRDKIGAGKLNALEIEPATPDLNPPRAPDRPSLHVRRAEIGIEWPQVASDDLVGYFVYRWNPETAELERITQRPVTDSFFVDREPLLEGIVKYCVSAVDVFGNESDRSEIAATSLEDFESGTGLGLNAGGGACVDEKGRKFAADRRYSEANGAGYVLAGSPRTSGNALPEPFRSFREGDVSYRIDVPEGIYCVCLGFADSVNCESRERLFHAFINDVPIAASLDLAADYGVGQCVEIHRDVRAGDDGLEIRVEGESGEGLLSFVHLQPADRDDEPPARPCVTNTVARDEVVFLQWACGGEHDLAGYRVLRSSDASDDFLPMTETLVPTASFVDRSVTNDMQYAYRIIAVDVSGNESDPSPDVVAMPSFPDDDELLDIISRAAFEFFAKECDPKTYLTKDKSNASFRSTASMGFGLSAMCIGAERGWMSRQEAERRCYSMLRTVNQRSDNKKFGLFHHYLDSRGGPSTLAYEDVISTVDSALLAWGAIAAGEYFGGRVRSEAELLVVRMNWKAFSIEDTGLTSMAYNPSTGKFEGKWDYYSDEAILIVLLAIGAANPDHRLGPEFFYSFKRNRKSYQTVENVVHTWPGSLFTYMFAHCWLDFRKLGPDNPARLGLPESLKVDWWENTRKAVEANRLFCISLSQQHGSFGSNSWGLTACSGPQNSYIVPAPPPCGPESDAGGGTVALYGAGMSMPFMPDEAMNALRHYYSLKNGDGQKILWRDEFDGGYGFVDSYNLDEDFVSGEVHGINHGPMLLLIENHRSGLLWKLTMKNDLVRRALRAVGYELSPSQ